MKKHLFNLFAASLLFAGSSLAFGQGTFDTIIQAADSQLKQFAQTGTCQGGSCGSAASQTKSCGSSASTEASASSCSGSSCSDDATTSDKAVATALQKIKFLSGKPNLEADYYIYLYSASWCPPCRKLMPSLVKEYSNIQKSGKVELILIGADQTEQKAKDYVEKYKAKFPATWQGTSGVAALPGNEPPRGIPAAIIVDKAGAPITSGHGSIVLDWKKHTIDKK